MRKSVVKAKLRENQPVLITQLHLTDPSLFEMASLMGFDCLWMDLEHHAYSVETASHLMRGARVGNSDIVARPGKWEYMRMARLLEAGATGILYPRCDDAEEAKEVVKWAKFAPLGKRGVDGASADLPFRFFATNQYIEEANRETFIVVQVEEQAAVDRAEEIAAVDGIDGIMLGPGDFSVLSGIPGDVDHDKVTAASKAIAQAVEKHGKHWGQTSRSADDTKRLLDMGARLIFQGSDLMGYKKVLQDLQESVKPLGFTFDPRY